MFKRSKGKTTILQFLSHLFGSSYNLNQYLLQKKHLNEGVLKKSDCISLDCVPSWENLKYVEFHYIPGEEGDLEGEKRANEIDQLLIRTTTTDNSSYECDIQEVFGFSNSKSDLIAFKSTDDMVKTNSTEMIDEITIEKLAENLKHGEIRIINSTHTDDHFVRKEWDGRLFLDNGGGSHHFAAAKYIARLLDVPVKLHAQLRESKLNQFYVERLAKECGIYVFKGDERELNELALKLMEYKCPFQIAQLDYRIWYRHWLVILDKSDKKAKKVINLMNRHGYNELTQHWLTLIS